MKKLHILLLGCLFSAVQAFGTGQPCANQQPGGASQPPGGGSGGGSGGGGGDEGGDGGGDSSPPPGDCHGTNFFSAYSGNAHREVIDLEVFGSVGKMPLKFKRFSNTRAVSQSSSQGRFGREGVWTHSYQWYVRSGGLYSNGQPTLRVGFPDGTDQVFVQDVLNPALWLGTANSNWEIRQSGSQYEIQAKTGEIYRFEQRTHTTAGSIFYRMTEMEDAIGNVSTFGYSSANDTLLRQVTDASGRWLKLTYLNQGAFAQQRVSFGSVATGASTGVWNEITVTSQTACRYLTLFYSNDFTNAPAVPVGELEFYDENNNLITGTAFGSTPVAQPGEEVGKAFDGNDATWYRYAYMRNGYVGLDLGTGVSKKVSRIRYFIPAGVATTIAPFQFIGMNDVGSSNNVVKEVSASDGRKVVYNYSIFDDASGWFRWGWLSSVSYPDGSAALYSQTQVHPYTRPVIAHCMDPRLKGKGVVMAYDFDGDTAVGFLRREKSGITGEIVAGTAHDGSHKPKAVYPNGKIVACDYGSLNANMTKRTDGNGKAVSYTFDQSGAGHVLTRKDARGLITSFTRNPLGRILTKTNPDGSLETWTYDAKQRPLSLTFSGPGIASRTTGWTRDTRGRVTRIDYPDGTFETWTFNSYGQPLQMRYRNGGVVTRTYGSSGLLQSHTDAEGNATTYTHNALDLVQTVTDARGNVTSYAYNDRGLVTSITQADSSVRTFTYDDYGNQISETNEIGKTSTQTYDEFKRVLTSTDPLNRTTVYSYGDSGGGCGACNSDGKPVLITLPSGRQTRYQYDVEWNLTAQTEGYGTASAATTSYAYDSNYNLTTLTNPEGHVTKYAYNNANRQTSITDALLRRTDYTYDGAGNILTVKRPGSVTSTFTYDSMNRRVTSTDAKAQVLTFEYDALGSLSRIIDPRGHSHFYTYDLNGRQTRLDYPDSSYETWGYDDAGNLEAYRTRAGQTATITNDVRNRATHVDRSGTDPDVTRVYDAAGRVLSLGNGQSLISYSYDDANHLLTEEQDIAGAPAAWTVTYTYNADGKRDSVTYPGGEVIGYSYTARNQLEEVTAGGPPPIATYSYNLDGTRQQRALENGLASTYAYDVANQLTGVSHVQGASQVAQRGYAYSSRGLLTSAQVDSGLWDVYGHDLADQVTSVKHQSVDSIGTSPAATVTYTYDPSGNRTQVRRSAPSQPTVTDAYAAATAANQYSSVDGGTFSYDANGNLTAQPGTVQNQPSALAASYDAQNRLVSATVGSGSLTQVFDTLNRVVSRTVNGTTTYLVWDGWNLIEERSSSGTLLKSYVHGAQTDELLAIIDAVGTHYFAQDALGSVIALLDAAGQVAERYTYDAYGNAAFYDGAGIPQASSLVGNRFLYTGREWLAEVGLYDYRNRVYSPSLSRFLQTDPIRFSAGDANLYRYVMNCILRFVDPFGLDLVLAGGGPQHQSNPNGDGGTTWVGVVGTKGTEITGIRDGGNPANGQTKQPVYDTSTGKGDKATKTNDSGAQITTREPITQIDVDYKNPDGSTGTMAISIDTLDPNGSSYSTDTACSTSKDLHLRPDPSPSPNLPRK